MPSAPDIIDVAVGDAAIAFLRAILGGVGAEWAQPTDRNEITRRTPPHMRPEDGPGLIALPLLRGKARMIVFRPRKPYLAATMSSPSCDFDAAAPYVPPDQDW